MNMGDRTTSMKISTEKDNETEITLNRQQEALHQECLVVKLTTVSDLAFCHESLTIAKRVKRGEGRGEDDQGNTTNL